ncbi:MAG: hypothetical protein AVDCRST_MAG67-3483 [uncultured Solirubrobacteraceae bacterium]|uniref:Uncharacterized protein n=1 Tax=uncultured Solirubrobacteraceae bacterium TaxID=1162706 RepID=A0A6J4TIP0_9ACTN|nr:MAG: hypothetical protein AVDCRST_MAG67-3483 [uncultured Solirubrobacteraceae bacterium]
MPDDDAAEHVDRVVPADVDRRQGRHPESSPGLRSSSASSRMPSRAKGRKFFQVAVRSETVLPTGGCPSPTLNASER